MSALLQGRQVSDETLGAFTAELLVLPKAGKTASAEHRQTLYTILGEIRPSGKVSSEIAFTLPSLLAKETSEAVIPALRDALSLHFAFVLKLGDIPVPATVISTFVKETAGPKPILRRAFLHVVGVAFEPSPTVKTGEAAWSKSAEDLAKALLPSLETDLKTAVASPLNAAAGPMEGYVTVATFVHPRAPISAPRKLLSGTGLALF